MMKVAAKARAAKHAPYVRLEGCPVSLAEQVLPYQRAGAAARGAAAPQL